MPDYAMQRRLGAGAFGEVWLCVDRALGETLAVKFIPPDRIQNPTNFYHEPQSLKALSHEHVVRVADAGKLADGRLYVAMEYVPGGSIEDRFQGGIVPLRLARQLLVDACYGLTYTHDQGFVHRDLKPANILIADGEKAKLSDFGLCTNKLVQGGASVQGYILHIAPEVLQDDVFVTASDIYALGLTGYRMVNGDDSLPIFQDVGELKDLIIAGKYPNRAKWKPFVPARFRAVLQKAMSLDCTTRFESARLFRHALERIRLPYDWRELTLAGETHWIATSDRDTWRIEVSQNRSNYSISTFQLTRSGVSRRRTELCFTTKSKPEHLRQLSTTFSTINEH